MHKQEDETRGDELRQVAERLASAMTSALRGGAGEGGSAAPTSKAAAESAAAPVLGGRSASVPGLGPLSVAAQNLEQATKQAGGLLSWMATLNPVLGLMRLAGGGSKTGMVELPKFEGPVRQSYLGGISAESGWSPRAADYGAGWQARTMDEGRPSPAEQVTVQVQAIDSRSFLDHRDEIAAAVRQALLESHSLGDVMGER